ncbi:hypothetical protein PMI05_01595 [Brevibacillus sp. BC25]|nr:hypothetical protein PMI05_01595 [Brevibacillus sp. BC25]
MQKQDLFDLDVQVKFVNQVQGDLPPLTVIMCSYLGCGNSYDFCY